MTKPVLIMLSGPPGCGKSTAVKEWLSRYPDALILSTDALIERYARYVGKTYSEVFFHCVKRSGKRFTKLLKKAREIQCDVIWDQCNLTQVDRYVKASNFPNHYKILVYAQKNEDMKALLKKRNDTRERGPMNFYKVVGPRIELYEEPEDKERYDLWDETYYL